MLRLRGVFVQASVARSGGGITTKVSPETPRTIGFAHYLSLAGQQLRIFAATSEAGPHKRSGVRRMSRLLVATTLCFGLAASGLAFAQSGAAGTGAVGATITPGSGTSDSGMVAKPGSNVDAGINASGSSAQQSPNANSGTNGTMSPGTQSGSMNGSMGSTGGVGGMGAGTGGAGAGGAGGGAGAGGGS
jgi:hypothetical protein